MGQSQMIQTSDAGGCCSGRALNEMVAGAYPDISTRSLEDFRTLQGVRAWLALRQLN
jgi:hypothetical protein